jgi:hypothetical protein
MLGIPQDDSKNIFNWEWKHICIKWLRLKRKGIENVIKEGL